MPKRKTGEDFEVWKAKYDKTKAGRIFNLKQDLDSLWNHELMSVDKPSHLAALAWIMAENTKYEGDVKEVIEMLVPDFFEVDL